MKTFLARGGGHIAVVASLAGYRGLPGAAAYGATKAALINMCEALKPDLERSGVKLSLINPGFVETPLTAQNDFPMPFLIPVDEAVSQIVRGLERSNFEIAFPGRFAFLMKVLRILPDRLFFTLSRRMLRE
jgi:short-subunit dehydrogenase